MATSPRAYVPGLDGLRALAILLVIVHNTSINEADAGLVARVWTGITDCGWIGVQLFFVLSGFLITGILLDGRDRPGALRTFYLRRALRIFPLYYLFLIGRFLVLPLAMPELAVPFSQQIWYWLYLSNWSDLVQGSLNGMSHFWSLAVEEQFYLTWPAAVRKLRPHALAGLCLAITLVALGFRIGCYVAGVDHAWMYSATVARADGLALGALVALASRSEFPERFVRARRIIGGIAAAGMLVVAVQAHGLSRYNPEIQTVGYTLLAIVFAALVGEIADPSPPRALRWLELPGLRSIGRYSYAMYVVHAPLHVVILAYAGSWLHARSAIDPITTDVLWTGAIAVASYLLALVSYALIEGPFLRLKDRWAPA
jgi:peptidoglycan/LPS O-acetylase OafA/YrhL